jgi:hypothetical protein
VLLKLPCSSSATTTRELLVVVVQLVAVNSSLFQLKTAVTAVARQSLTHTIWSAATLKYIRLSGMMLISHILPMVSHFDQSRKPMALLLNFLEKYIHFISS